MFEKPIENALELKGSIDIGVLSNEENDLG